MEETQGAGAGPEGNGAGIDPVAVALAMAGASRERADSFLMKQEGLIAAQLHHLHEQIEHLHLDMWEKRLGVWLRAATFCVGVAVAGGLSLLIWQAAHSDGLRVQAFSVPPALAERGLTGEAVAARVIDRLSELQSVTNTARSSRSYSNSWGDKAIKLEIPEAGISLDELDTWLREKVGHETALTGEVVRTDTGVTLTARAGEDGAVSVSGPEADMDNLLQKLAEQVYRITQPYRYATYLMRHENRPADAVPIFRELALHGSPEDRRWSYEMWAQAAEFAEVNKDIGLKLLEQAHAANPDSTLPYPPLIIVYAGFGRIEEAVKAQTEELALRKRGDTATGVARTQADHDLLSGAFHDALPIHTVNAHNGIPGFPLEKLLGFLILDQIGEHDFSAARASLTNYPREFDRSYLALQIDTGAENWRQALGHEDELTAYIRAFPQDRHYAFSRLSPSLALAHAHLGELDAAEGAIAPTAGDCYPCLIARARIAEMEGKRARAEWWFDRATAAGPSLPFAFDAEGRALLDRRQPDQAIARFTIANQKSPHFADPLEGWGEALMAKNQSHLALAKFAQADKYAPNWGRLHLKWGEALYYAGRKDEARAELARAAQLDLTPSEKAELAKVTLV